MKLTNQQFVEYWNQYKVFVDEISNRYQYPTNISHLLYFIIPAFVFQYGVHEEKLILDVFKNVRIVIQERHDEVHQAVFSRSLRKENDLYVTDKTLYLYCYEHLSLIELLENLVHEFNHAINSIKNEVQWNDMFVSVRMGIGYYFYDINTLKPIGNQQGFLLEEIINIRQTEKMIERIASFGKYAVSDTGFINVLYVIRKEVSEGYRSRAYFLQSLICKKILDNRTFISTIEQLRFQGEISELDNWFDAIVGIDGSFERMNELLNKTVQFEQDLSKMKSFRRWKMRKMNRDVGELFQIMDMFHQNCNYK